MSTQPRMARSLKVLRDLGPYLFIELLLPGGTLFALLLWLSRRFVRNDLTSVRQYTLRQRVQPIVARAKPHRRIGRVCTCIGRTVAFSVSPPAFQHRCARNVTLQAA